MWQLSSLGSINQASYASLHLEEVDVDGIHIHVHGIASRSVGQRGQDLGVLNSGKIESTCGLAGVLEVHTERDDEDAALLGDSGVIDVWVESIEVWAFTSSESVAAGDLEAHLRDGLETGSASGTGGVVGVEGGPSVCGFGSGFTAVHHEFLGGVVEGELDCGVRAGEGLSSVELELSDQVGVALVDEAISDVVGHEDVVDPHVEAGKGGSSGREGDSGSGGFVAGRQGLEPDVELHGIEEDGREGERETCVLGEVEAKGKVELGGSVGCLEGLETIVVMVNVRGVGGILELILLSDHVVVTFGLACGQDEGHLGVIEVSVVSVDGETSDLEFYLLDDGLCEVRGPTETGVCASDCDSGDGDFENDILEEIARSGDFDGYAATEVGSSGDCLLNTFDREDLVPAVNCLKETYFRVLCQPLILWAGGHKLCQSARHRKGLKERVRWCLRILQTRL